MLTFPQASIWRALVVQLGFTLYQFTASTSFFLILLILCVFDKMDIVVCLFFDLY